MRYRKFWFLTLMALCAFTAFAQQHAVEVALQEFDNSPSVAAANRFFDLLDKEQFTESKIQFSPQVPADSVRQQVWYWATEWFYDKQDYARAESYGLKALPLYKGESGDKADCLNLMGCVYVRMGDFKKAATHAQECLHIDMASGDHDRISSSMNTLAGIYMAAQQTKEAEKLILQAIEHADLAKNEPRKAVLLGTAAEIYHSLSQEEKALDYAQQAYDIEQKLGRPLQAAYRLDQKASALIGLKRYAEAEQALRRAIPVMCEAGDMHSLAIASNHMGTCLIWQEREEEAYPYYREAADILAKMGDAFNEMYAHRGLCLSLWESNSDSARIELDRFNILRDSLYNSASAEAMARMNAEFGNDQLTIENAKVRSHLQRGLLLAAGILLLLALCGWYIVRRLQKREQLSVNKLMHEIERLRSESAATQVAAPAQEPVQDAVVQQATAEESTADMPENEFLKEVIAFVNEHLPLGDFGLEDIAAHFRMSVSTLRRRLTEATGDSPKSYIQAIQMQKACDLLDGDTPIADIALQCGFSEPSSFTRTFKRVMGITPTQYRDKAPEA